MNKTPKLTDSDLKRFWSKVDKNGDCWLWTASLRDGYGAFRIGKKMYRAPRIAYTIKHSDPGEFEVCHTCDNTLCVNPAHLWLGTCLDMHTTLYERIAGLQDSLRRTFQGYFTQMNQIIH